MSSLSFSLRPDAMLRLHDLLVCLSKFGDAVSLQADASTLRLCCLNLTCTAHVSVRMEPSIFAQEYKFWARQERPFACQISIKALLSVFSGRIFDPRDRDNAIERADVSLHDRDFEGACRLTVAIICRHGVTKTYRLSYEAVDVQDPQFDPAAAPHRLVADARLLREVVDHVGPGADLLDICPDLDGRHVRFTSVSARGGGADTLVPITTAVALDRRDLATIVAPNGMHITVSARDFRAIVVHAVSLAGAIGGSASSGGSNGGTGTSATTIGGPIFIDARFCEPCDPLCFSYGQRGAGIKCDFTLMTRGDSTGGTMEGPGAAVSVQVGNRSRQRQASAALPPAAPRPGPSRQASVRASPALAPTPMPVTGSAPASWRLSVLPQPQPRARSAAAVSGQRTLVASTAAATHAAPRAAVTSRPTIAPEPSGNEPPRPTAPPIPPVFARGSQSLFVPADDDQPWDGGNGGDDGGAEKEDILGWDASMDRIGNLDHFDIPLADPLAKSGHAADPEIGDGNDPWEAGPQTEEEQRERELADRTDEDPYTDGPTMRIPPTQRVSEIRGLFD